MPLSVLGNEVSVYHIGRRQLKERGPRKRNKALIVFKRKSVPSETKYSLEARLCLAHAAMDMRGHTFEEVVNNVRRNCSKGKYAYKPKEVWEAEKEAKYRASEANVRRMEEKLSGERGIGVAPPVRHIPPRRL